MNDTTVADLMSTALITMHPDDTVARADVEMRLARIRHILVVDGNGKLQGIVSNRDILLALGEKGETSVRIGDIMTRRVYTTGEDQPAHHAAALMLEHKIGALPVVGDEGQLVGVLTETDFLRFAHRELGGADYDVM